jgi:hypothetical protein
LEKLSAGKFHFEPPFTSLNHLVGDGEQPVRHGQAKHPGGRGVDDEFNFAACSTGKSAGLAPLRRRPT